MLEIGHKIFDMPEVAIFKETFNKSIEGQGVQKTADSKWAILLAASKKFD